MLIQLVDDMTEGMNEWLEMFLIVASIRMNVGYQHQRTILIFIHFTV